MTWTNLSFPFGSLLSSTQMTQLDANLDALAAGDSGAPALKVNIGIYNVSSSDVSTIPTTSGAWRNHLPFNVYIPSAANTIVMMNRHSGTTSATNEIRIVSSGGWAVSGSTSNDYRFPGYPETHFGTAYMDVSSIRGSRQTMFLQVKSATNIILLSSLIHFE